MFTALKQFIFLENAQDRYLAIKNYTKNAHSWQLNLLTWQILSLLPTNKEKATLAQSLKMTRDPGSEWAIFTYLLQEEHDDEVIKECILNLAQDNNHSLGDKIRTLADSKINNPEILSAILDYVEKTGDERFKSFLQKEEIFDCCPSFIEKLLNGFLKLGILSSQAKHLCFQIIEQNKNNETCDYKLNSVVYTLFFSANKFDIEKLKKLKQEITNRDLLKIFDLCFSFVNPIAQGQTHLFFEQAFLQSEPLFLGYGILEQEKLNELTENFLNKHAIEFPLESTKTILSLRNSLCTKILSEHKILGISALEKTKNEKLAQIWAGFCPFENSNFVRSVQNPENYFLWHNKNSSHLGFVLLDYETLFNPSNPWSAIWQDFFEENLTQDTSVSVNIILFQIIALRNSKSNKKDEVFIINNVKSCLKKIVKQDSFIDQIYAICISTNSTPQFIKEIYNLIPFSCTSWVFIAIALTAPKLDIQTLNYAILRELNSIREALLNENLNKDDYILEVTTRFQSIIVGADKYHVQVTQATLAALKDIAHLIQTILDSLENLDENTNDELDNSTDWNGRHVIDKPILRWNAVLQVCLNSFLTQDELLEYEIVLSDGLRAAPHVEKRWVVRALVHIDSENSIKSILYHALNHIDKDFVEQTVYELCFSKHSRAKQALIRCLPKKIISDKIKTTVIENLKKSPTQEIYQELKELSQQRLPEKIERAVHDALMEIGQKITDTDSLKKEDLKFTSAEIDFVIKSFLPNVSLLFVDSRSALRTAEMIYIQSKDWGTEAVDLSPIVNMYCKSVELVLRDTFEPFTDAILRKGYLSKLLESLGYGKLTQDKMQGFEDFIADLPIIKTIPYFSKFKLRKMLRAICLYRPGKRFTLDGPKAFALFLLVTGRKTCPYSFEKLFQLSFATDLELFDFVKQIHSLQDSRNRAVHEGLTWEAREEIDQMRKQSYSIIDTCLKIGIKLQSTTRENEVMTF